MRRYQPPTVQATVLPSRDARWAAVLGYLRDRCGRVSFTSEAFREMRARGMSYARVMATVEQLADAGRVRVRRLPDGFRVELVVEPGLRPRGPFCG